MTRLSLRLFGPVLVWALHFAAIYALISAACAPRGLLDIPELQAAAAMMTGAGAVACLVFLLTAGRALRRAGNTEVAAPLAQAARWSALISLLAVIANAWPVAMLTACGG